MAKINTANRRAEALAAVILARMAAERRVRLAKTREGLLSARRDLREAKKEEHAALRVVFPMLTIDPW